MKKGDIVIHNRTEKQVRILHEAEEWHEGDFIVEFVEDTHKPHKLYIYAEEDLTTQEEFNKERAYIILIYNHKNLIIKPMVVTEFPNLSTLHRVTNQYHGSYAIVKNTTIGRDI